MAYDVVLRTAIPPGSSVICYADDTLLLARGENWDEARAMANLTVACVVGTIGRLGLQVAPQKTEAVFFHGEEKGAPPITHINVEGIRVEVEDVIKYLGVYIDGRWTFRQHFARLVPRADKVAVSLGRLLPNLGGPDGRVRRLYCGIVHAVALYGAPVWAREARATRQIRDEMRRVQRRVALRACRAYRTVSFWAATVLAGIPPFELLAQMYQYVYEELRRLARGGGGGRGFG